MTFNTASLRALRALLPVFICVLPVLVFSGEDAPNGGHATSAAPDLGVIDQILGKDLNGWIAHLKNHENEKERKLALSSIAEFGPAAAPAAPEIMKLAADDFQPEVQRWSIIALGAIGPVAKPAIPDVLNVLASGKTAAIRAAACASASQIDPESPAVRRAVLAAVHDREHEVRNAAIDALVTLAPFDSNALPALLHALLAPSDENAAKAAALALSCLEESGVDALSSGLERGTAGTRLAAAEALGHMGAEARQALPVVLKTLGHDRDGRLTAALMLAAVRIAPKDPGVLTVFAEHLPLQNFMAGDRPASVEQAEAFSTGVLTKAGAAALPALRTGLRSHDARVRLQMVNILAKLTPFPEDAISDLASRAQDKDHAVSMAAVKVLDAMGPAAVKAHDILADVAKNEVEDEALKRAAAVAALNVARDPNQPRFHSPLDPESEADLLRDLKDANPKLRMEAAEALRSREDDSGRIATALIATLDDSDESVRIAAAKSLLRFGKFARVAVSKFTGWLDSNNGTPKPVLQKAALTALAGMGEDAKSAQAATIKIALSGQADDDKEFQKLIGIVLRVIGPDVVPDLVKELKSPDQKVRSRAARTLASMGPVAAAAVPDLIEFSQNPDDADSRLGFFGLESIGPVAYLAAASFLADEIRTDVFADRRKWAVYAAGAIGVPEQGDPRKIIDALQLALIDPDESVCRATHSALMKIGKPAIPRMSELVKMGEGEASYWWALRVLARMKAEPDEVIPRLAKLTLPGVQDVKQGAFAERGTAAELLGEYAPAHTECIPALVRVLADREDYVARAAVRSLALFGSQALEPIKKVLHGRNPLMRHRALEALAAIREAEENTVGAEKAN